MLPTGIQATWEAPADGATLHYNLYRSAAPEITSVAGLTPRLSGITGLSAVDASPSVTEHTYAVTALDPAGNESPPSNSVYFKPPRLPVASLSVVQQDTAAPVLTWMHPDTDLAGYDLYLGPAEGGFKLNDALLTATTYTDTGYNGDERRYTVVAVGRDEVRSPGRSLLLPKLKVQAPAGGQVRRGLMNRVDYQVSNESSQAVENATLQVRIGEHDQVSPPFTVAAGQTVPAPVVIGGHVDLADVSPVVTTLTIEPHAGEQVQIVRTGEMEVTDGAVLVQILTQQMTRGGAGKVRFGLENRGTAEMDIVIAKTVGSASSDDIRFTLVDSDGNVLAVQPFQQGAGDGLIGLPDGRTVARIPAGGRFDSQWIDLPVPSAAPTQATVELTIDPFHYHLGRPEAVSIAGTVGRQAVSLVDTAYTCALLSVAPAQSRGDQDVVITGRAVERASGAPLPRVPLRLVISSGGFERYFEVYTDELGGFLYAYKPLPTESGVYRVSCIHPTLRERPEQGSFTLGRVIVAPTQINLNMPRDYDQTVPVTVTAGAAATATNLRLQYLVQDQPEGQWPPGIQISLSEPLSLAERQTGTLRFTLRADDAAYQTGALVLRVVSDGSSTPWALIRVNYTPPR